MSSVKGRKAAEPASASLSRKWEWKWESNLIPTGVHIQEKSSPEICHSSSMTFHLLLYSWIPALGDSESPYSFSDIYRSYILSGFFLYLVINSVSHLFIHACMDTSKCIPLTFCGRPWFDYPLPMKVLLSLLHYSSSFPTFPGRNPFWWILLLSLFCYVWMVHLWTVLMICPAPSSTRPPALTADAAVQPSTEMGNYTGLYSGA